MPLPRPGCRRGGSGSSAVCGRYAVRSAGDDVLCAGSGNCSARSLQAFGGFGDGFVGSSAPCAVSVGPFAARAGSVGSFESFPAFVDSFAICAQSAASAGSSVGRLRELSLRSTAPSGGGCESVTGAAGFSGVPDSSAGAFGGCSGEDDCSGETTLGPVGAGTCG